jgi:DNA-binding response OmpR family regulator
MSLVLLVEDDLDLCSLLTQSLKYFGHFDVVGVADGISGLEQSVKLLPACVIIDIKMPGLDGYQLVRALRGDAKTASIPLIILTALGEDQDRFTGLASGADRFLQKPVKPQDLAKVIRETIQIDKAARIRQLNALVGEQDQADG